MSNLRVWWIPQLGMDGKPFVREVENVKEGWKFINLLADYDLYQLDNNIKPDYSNVGGLEQLDKDGEWCEWQDSNGDSLDEIERWLDGGDTMSDYFDEHGVNGLLTNG